MHVCTVVGGDGRPQWGGGQWEWGVIVTADQLVLFAMENGNGRKTAAEAGLTRELGPGAGGPERLMRELVRRGLPEEGYRAAAALVIALEEVAGG